MNYKEYIKYRAILFGSVSPLVASKRILRKLNSSQVCEYGEDVYEQAYNYYQVRYKNQILHKLLIIILILWPLPLIFKLQLLPIKAIFALYYTGVSYYLRKRKIP
jgi:hypothetical protein